VVAEHSLHVLVTGGAGYIGSHAALFLLENGYHVTALDNLSRGNVGAIHVLQQIAIPGRFNFIKTDLSDLEDVSYSQLCVLYSCGLRVCVHVPKSLKRCDMVLYGQFLVSSYCFIWEQWLCSVP
jgi:nucleoside-diphosphate-sugar epimerase